MRKHLWTYCIVLGVLLSSCSIALVREAQEVVAQADSLWHKGKMYGVDEGDSATLAQAYERLKELSAFSRQKSEYAHACYHYGKLLRAKDDPAAAMQAFLDATHSGTKDYHILGRVYSNIGSICHLAGEFQLSYDMYERSANMFLQNGDSLLYYYLLNDMAFELAEQGKKEETFGIISQIEKSCTDAGVIAKTLETKAEACLYTHQYDSILYYTDLLFSNNRREPNIFLLRAQAFTYLERKDSAVYYANYVLSISDELFNKNSALYILTQDDESKDKQDIRMTSADRSDVQKLIEIRQGKLSQAVQLLEQDLNRKPDYRWLYIIIVTLVIVGTCIYIYVYRKRRQHQLLSQQVEDLRHEAESIQERHEQIVQEHIYYTDSLITQIERNCIILCQSEDFPNNICWKDFNAMSKIINDNFGMLVQKLQNMYNLKEKEIRLCVLVLFDKHSSKQLARLLFYAESGVRNFKNRLAKKLGTNSTEFRKFLINLAISEYSKCTR